MRRVFFFTGNAMRVFEWRGRQLLGSYDFKSDSSEESLFVEYLKAAVPMPAQLLVDLLEEDFRRESIPHVSRGDQKVLVTRLLDRHYRGNDHTHVQFQERAKHGRRDDYILLSALSSMDVLTPWLEKFNCHQIPLAGIWSLPLLSSDLIKAVSNGEPNILMVSSPVSGTLRQSFFQNGHLILSRQAKTEGAVTVESILESLAKGVDQIHRFLTNQRMIGFTEELQVYCILPEYLLESARRQSQDTGTVQYHFVGLAGLFEHYKLQCCKGQGSDTLFSFLCSRSRLLQDHYSYRSEKVSFYQFMLDRWVSLATKAGPPAALVGVAIFWILGTELENTQRAIDLNTRRLQQTYTSHYGVLESKLNDALTVQETVTLATRLRREVEQTPQRWFPPLSQIYSDPTFAELEITSLLWKKYSGDELSQLKLSHANSIRGGDNAEQSDNQEEPMEPHWQPILNLQGGLNRADMSYRETVAIMREFVNALSALAGIDQVLVSKTPVDIRPGARFSDASGARSNEDNPALMNNRYEIIAILEGVALERPDEGY